MHDALIIILSALTIFAVLARPFRVPEWIWAVSGALCLVVFQLEPLTNAVKAFERGFDVFFFLIGMMLLSETSREEGLFSWLASQTSKLSSGSSVKLFTLIYITGVVVTIFMSNDATAVVLTPAVYACVKRSGASAKPPLFACALIANAASFVLPISNPANLVLYASRLPPLTEWLKAYFLPSVLSIASTYLLLRYVFRRNLREKIEAKKQSCEDPLTRNGKVVLAALVCVAAILLTCSELEVDLGLPTLAAALVIVVLISSLKRKLPVELFKNVSWSVVPLVGGLFIIVDGLDRAHVIDLVKAFFEYTSQRPGWIGKEIAAFGVGLFSNVANNLPVGLMAGLATQAASISEPIRRAILVGVDLGPNLSVTGSLATLLWLVALRREGENIGFWEFLKVGFVVMPISLFVSVLALIGEAT